MLGDTSGNVDKLYGVKKYIYGAFICLVVAACIFTQTDYFLRYTSPPSDQEITDHVRLSRTLQNSQQQARNPQSGPGKQFDTARFDSEKAAEVTSIARTIVVDHADSMKVFNKFGITDPDKVRAVFVPLEAMTTEEYLQGAGIQPTVWKEIDNAKSENPAGLTIRDKGPNEVKTLDGIPRIFLTPKAYDPKPQLRRTVAHELLHAMNIPAHQWTINLPGFKKPVALSMAQTDLSYLAEYRWFVRKAGLEPWDQTVIWGFIYLLLGFFAINALSLFGHFRQPRHFRHHRLRRVR